MMNDQGTLVGYKAYIKHKFLLERLAKESFHCDSLEFPFGALSPLAEKSVQSSPTGTNDIMFPTGVSFQDMNLAVLGVLFKLLFVQCRHRTNWIHLLHPFEQVMHLYDRNHPQWKVCTLYHLEGPRWHVCLPVTYMHMPREGNRYFVLGEST